VSGTLARVIERDPDWSALPPELPASVRRILQLCLTKDPRKRRQAAGDVRIDLDHALDQEPAGAAAPSRSRSARAAWATGAAIAVTILAVPAVVHFREAPPAELRLQVTTPPTREPLEFALSPDGRYIVFAGVGASADDDAQLYLRALDSTEAQPLAGTANGRFPFWSGDSRSIGFFAGESLLRVEITGGQPQVVAPAQVPMGGSWSSDGTILFSPNTVSPLLRVPASGGEPVAVTQLDRPRQMGHRLPSFLPDGRRFLYYVFGEPQVAGIYLGSLDGAAPSRLTPADTAGAFVGPDHVVFMQQGTLVARRLDIGRGQLVGDPVVVARGVGADARTDRGAFSVSATGIVAHRAVNLPGGQLTWFDRSGTPPQTVDLDVNGPELSPDDLRVAFDRTLQGNRDVWLLDLARGGLTRFTSDAGVDGYPIWSPDGSRIVFESTRKGTFDLWIKPSNAAETEQLLFETPDTDYPLDWSADGRFLLYQRTNLNEAWDLWALPMTGDDRTPLGIATTPFTERMGQFSPDGRWVAYETDESGRPEIMAQAFPISGGRAQISIAGGVAPRWSADGHEIYFVSPDGKIMAAAIESTATQLRAEPPVELFAARVTGQPFKHQYDVARDGRLLVRSLPVGEAPAPPITLIVNWRP
jgi:Tol biopolymer transport system component